MSSLREALLINNRPGFLLAPSSNWIGLLFFRQDNVGSNPSGVTTSSSNSV